MRSSQTSSPQRRSQRSYEVSQTKIRTNNDFKII
jgi:hypothetical protein